MAAGGQSGHERPPHLAIMGPMGVGKTVLAAGLGLALDRPVRDSDQDVEALFGRTGREIAGTAGVDALHELERAVFLGALAAPAPSVIAAAGWVVEDRWCREAMSRRATVVVLDLAVGELMIRMADGQHRRTVTRAQVEELARRRRPLLDEVADVRLDAGRSPAELVAEVCGVLER